MNDTQTLILKGCKFILTLGGSRWDSSLTRKALARLRDLCEMELGEKPIPEPAQTIQAQPGGGADDLDIPGMDLGGGAPPGMGMPPGDLMGAPDMGAPPLDAGAGGPPMGGE
jgi:hypothetical protein